ncbi:MAG: hypothetical protein K940chlam9_00693 [Chlamydiae bacterium]|nr:hypothetical protein [Chlamydiota bacterium]
MLGADLGADTYLSYVLSKPLLEVWYIFLLGLGRFLPAIAIAPFFGGKLLPDAVKVGFGIALTFIFLPYLIVQVKVPLTLDIQFMLLEVKEVIIGAVLGIFVAVPFYYAQGAGATIDHQRGAQSLQVMDPATQMRTSPTGTLYNDMMLVFFFFIGGPILFFEAFLTSYNVLPADQFIPASFFDSGSLFWMAIITMLNKIVTISLQLAAPSLIAMLLSDLFVGIANRMAPQVQISFLLWSMKAFLGVAIIWAGWWLVLKQIEFQADSWLKYFQKIVSGL